MGTDHESTLISMGNLTAIYCEQAKWEEAEELVVQVLQKSLMNLGEEHTNTTNVFRGFRIHLRESGKARRIISSPSTVREIYRMAREGHD